MSKEGTKTIDQILSVGIPLPIFSFSNWGLNRRQALIALHELMECSIPVLGGDVLRCENGKWVHSYDNWHCNKLPMESHDEFVIRSNKAAAEYVENYKISNESESLFVLVVSTL